MSLLGRLEDLSLTDIIQIVYLSRRTGVLEIINNAGRHTVMFRHGLVVNAASPELPDLVSFLLASSALTREQSVTVRHMEESGIPAGTAVLEMNLLTRDDLSVSIRQRILGVVAPLLQSKEGEFNFILSDNMTALDAEYEPDQLFKEGGFPPNRLLGTGEGEKLKPLRGLEESLKAGKALLRGAGQSEAPVPGLNLGLSAPAVSADAEPLPIEEEPLAEPSVEADPLGTRDASDDNVIPFPAGPQRVREHDDDVPFAGLDEAPFGDTSPEPVSGGLQLDEELPKLETPPPAEEPRPRSSSSATAGHFKVAGGLFEVESPDAAFRNVVLFERNPLVRVAARRAFTKHKIHISQFGTLADVRNAITDLFRSNSFFVTFLELDEEDASIRLLQQLKRRNPRLPVVMIDAETDLRRRHDLLRAGADLYVTRPAAARLLPGLIEEELSLFADELVLFAERSFKQWEQVTGGGLDAGRRFYEMANKETLDRSFGVLRQLISELSNPNDINQVTATILRLSAEYLDRGALFVLRDGEFVGLGGFGSTGDDRAMDARMTRLRISAAEPSLLADVAAAGEAHQGKMRRTAANVTLVESMGGLLPTEVIALPIMHSGRTIGILYGDNAENRAPIDSMTGLEIFLAQASYAFGNAVVASERAGRS